MKPFEGIVDKIFLADNLHQKLMPSKKVLSKTKNLKFTFVVKESMECLYAVAKNSSLNKLNLFIGSFYFSGEFFRFLLEKNNLPISAKSLGKII